MGRGEDLFEQIISGGVAAVEHLILERKSEELFLDFKRSADDGKDIHRLHDRDGQHLAKATSGFANSEGGAIVWGVDCSEAPDGADVAKAKMPVENAARFCARLESAVSRGTLPPHRGVRNHVIQVGAGAVEGFVLTLIPQVVDTPLQAVYDKRFYIRAGSSFEPASQGLIASLFTRRSEPIVFPMFQFTPVEIGGPAPPHSFTGTIIPILYNYGPGIARDIYFSLTLRLPGDNCDATFNLLDPINWDVQRVLGVRFSFMSKEGYRVAPKGQVSPFSFELKIQGPFINDMAIKLIFGAGPGPVRQFSARVPRSDVEAAGREFLKSKKGKDEAIQFLSVCMGIDQMEPEMKAAFGDLKEKFI